MKKISKLTYLLGLLALIGLSLLYSMNVAVGEISISIPSSMNLHRPQLWSLVLGSTGTQAIVEVNTGKNVLTIRNGLIMGRNNGSLQGARYVSIGGGVDNTISSVENSGIGGGNGNLVDSAVSVIGGGSENRVKADSKFNAVAGGYANLVAYEGSIVGGGKNVVIGRSVVVGGRDNYVEGEGSMAFGSGSKGGAKSFSWNSPIVRDYSAIIVATGGVLIGTYYPVTGVNLVVEGAVKIGTGLLTGNVGEIRMQSGCFYGYDGSAWHVINKKAGEGCPKVACTYGSLLLSPGDNVQAYTQPYSMDCSQNFQTVYCNEDGTLGNGGQYYPYCYNLTGGIWYAEEMAQCGVADGGTYVNSPTMADGLCANGTPGDIDTQNTLFAWQCTVGTSVANCSATRIYSCNGEQPTGPGVILGDTTQAYSTNLSSWTPVAQGVSPGVCQWTCAEGYEQQANGCSGDVINEPEGCGTYDPSVFKDLDMYFITNVGTTGHYALMDRNLGATQVYAGIDNICTYGYYYQWGNNYGFANAGSIKTSTEKVDALPYGPSPLNYYSSDTFIKSSGRDWSINQNDNLWGGNGSVIDRRGPCPEGYHIPSYSEFRNIIDNYWGKSVYNTGGSQFALDFLMPFAGYRAPNSNVAGQGSTGAYWYSSWSSSNPGDSVHLWFHRSVVPVNSSPRPDGMSIRCTRNSQDSALNIHPNEGKKALIIVHDNKITKLGTPTRDGKTFGGWYSDSSFTPDSQVRTGDTVLAGTHLYAKWESSAQCNGVSNVNGEITICNPDNCSECLTMMDKNLGASIAGTGGSSTYGKKYQWGNNYGFPDGSLSSVTTKATWNEIYDNNGYNGNKFIRNPQDYWSDGINHSNLRGGGDDSQDNGYGYPVTNLIGRKGPCPSGYHVPSAGELSKLIEWWCVGYQLEGNGVSCQPYSNGLYYITPNEIACTRFRADFLIPISYRRSPTTASIQNTNDFAFWWTSSTEGTSSRSLRMRNAHVESESSVRASGFSIRCFKNN